MSMKKLILVLAVLFGLLPVSRADENVDKLIDGLLGIGLRALQAEQEHRAEEAAQASAAAAQPAADASAGEDEPRTWLTRGRDMLSHFVSGTVDGLGDKPLSTVLAESMKKAADVLVNEYKEQYKQEGREYAREVGDLVVGRVLKDPKIEHSIYSLQALCWGVIVYLTLVTIVVVISLLHLKRTNVKLLAAVEELKMLGNKVPPAPAEQPEKK